MRERAVMSRVAGRGAAVILRRVTEALPMPASAAAYLRGHGDALDYPETIVMRADHAPDTPTPRSEHHHRVRTGDQKSA